jgi:signal transduction histidine kinase
LPHVFERFFRGDKSRQRIASTTGTGLGLSICHAIVAAHRGEIVVESTEGVGTTMTVRFPLRRETAPEPPIGELPQSAAIETPAAT